MFLFWRLLFAHLVADFPLQTGWVFREKTEHTWGVVFHGGVAGVLGLALAWPYLRFPRTWVVLLALWLFHILLDKGKILLNGRTVRGRWLVFVGDQALHVASVWVAAAVIDGPALGTRLFFYGSDRFFQLASAYLATTYSVLVLVSSIKGSRPGEVLVLPRLPLRLVEFGERIAITTLAMVGGMFYVFISFCLVPRIFLRKSRPGEITYWELFLSLILSVAVGVLFRNVVLGYWLQ
ncbi:MAG: DUF3307 domain-containing protein [bacterium]